MYSLKNYAFIRVGIYTYVHFMDNFFSHLSYFIFIYLFLQ